MERAVHREGLISNHRHDEPLFVFGMVAGAGMIEQEIPKLVV